MVWLVFPTCSRAASATFYLQETETQFSVNIANDSDAGDVFLYFTSPAHSWVGVGFGETMRDSLMFILYPSRNGTGVYIHTSLWAGEYSS